MTRPRAAAPFRDRRGPRVHIKAWLAEYGTFHQAVHDVATAEVGATVDPDTCEQRGVGAATLCAIWTDPGFESDRAAVHYARVVETPSCRWSTWACLSMPPDERPDGCSDQRVPRTIQERGARTSAQQSLRIVASRRAATPVANGRARAYRIRPTLE